MKKQISYFLAFLLFLLLSSAFLPAQVLLGDQNVENTLDTDAVGTAEAFQTTASAGGVLNSLSLYVDPSSTVSQLAIGLYSDSVGHPSVLLTQGVFTPQAGGWNTVSVIPVSVVAGSTYWIAVLGLGNGRPFFRDNLGGCSSETSSSEGLTGLPVAWSTGAIWASCTLSAYGSSSNATADMGPFLLGDQNVESDLDSHFAGRAEAFQTNAVASGALSLLSVYIDANSTANQIALGLYSDSGGQPSSLLTQATFTPQTGNWNMVNVPAVPVSAGTNYWIAMLGLGGGRAYFRTSGSNCNSVGGGFGQGALPSTWFSDRFFGRCLLSAYGISLVATPAVGVSVSPTSVSLPAGGTQQFNTTVTGTTNMAVSWSATGGNVSPSGLYTAPSTAGTYTVTATSAVDPTKSASATVTVSGQVAISISPALLTISLGGTQQFTATVTGTTNTAVTWTASGGTISTSGLFAAPAVLIGVYTVTATSVADSTQSASALVTVILGTPPPVGNAGCGATAGGAAPYDQTQCGNVGGNFPAIGGTISSCGSYSGILTLSQDISTDGSSVCLTVGTGSTINLGGHTVTGLIKLGDPASGTHIYNGTVLCSASSAGISPNEACVYGNLSGPMTAPLVLDHLTLLNQNTASGTGSQTFLLDWNPSSVSVAAPQVQISYITSSAPAVINSPRTGNIWINGQPTWTAELDHLDLTCGPSSNACQGLTLWNGRAHLHDSRITMSNLSLPQDGRGFICDGDSSYCEANNNYIDAQNNRAFRLRQYTTSGVAGPLSWHDNLIDNIQNNLTRAAIHLCDPDNTSNTLNASNATFSNNTLVIGNRGAGVWAINCGSPGPVIKDNVVKCLAAGNCGTIAHPTGEYGVATFLTVYDNTLDPGTAGPQSSSNTTVNYCNTGTCVSNGGTCSLISPCPTQ